MAFNNNITTSIGWAGRRLGLQRMSTGQTGSANGFREYLVGPDGLRMETTTADSTGANLKPDGFSWLQGTSVGSSSVYVLDPPIVGVGKRIAFAPANGPTYLKTANAETLVSSLGSSFTTVKGASLGGVLELQPLTTAQWAIVGFVSTGSFSLTTTT